jgi:2-polyprenyl-6-methoxyphenol hydroxylase-like FAD-dependent oxidoreductase
VLVTASDGSTEAFDLVVGADGIHSGVRRIVFGRETTHEFDTGWGGWVWWSDPGPVPSDAALEYWGVGSYFGVFPAPGQTGVFAGGPVPDRSPNALAAEFARLRARFAALGPPVADLLAGVPADPKDLFFWHLADVRSDEWVRGRVVLLGDAAAGFLPTAGVGASMALESAAVLNDELMRTDAAGIPQALRLYEKRRRQRVLTVQNDSRRLAGLMFRTAAPLVLARNVAMHFASLEMIAANIVKSLEEPI